MLRIPSFLFLLLLAPSLPAAAATFHVDDTGDVVDATPGDGACATAGGACTLRAAVQEANSLAGADRIRVPAGTYRLEISGGGENDAARGDLDVRGRLRIVGDGAGETIVDGGELDRVFDVQAGARVTFLRLAVVGGKTADASGGGINAAASSRLLLKRVLIEGNEAFIGGGIAASGRLKMVASTVRLNFAAVGGGAAISGATAIRSSTFNGNTATGFSSFLGHDVAAQGAGDVLIANSTSTGQIQTIAYCEALSSVCHDAPDVVLANVTANDLSQVALGAAYPGSFTLRNTIVGDCHAELISQGYNFVVPEGCIILGSLAGVVVGDDPLLSSLSDHGGPTETRVPVGVSAAVNGGHPGTPGTGGGTCEALDQRGVVRDQRLPCDIGAVEAP